MTLKTYGRAHCAAFALMLTLALAACGGGGGSGPSGGGSAVPVVPAVHAKFTAGFSGAHRGAAGIMRQTQALSGTLQPIADFVLAANVRTGLQAPFSYPGVIGVAFYDPTTGAVPSPLPTVVWSEVGLTTAFAAAPTTVSIPGMTIVSQQFVTMPATTGTGNLIASASNGDSVTLSYNAYDGVGISTQDPSGTSGYGFPLCVTFTATGYTGGATGDICLSHTPDSTGSITGGTYSLIAANGALLVQKPIDAVTLADATNVPTTTTTIAGSSLVAGAGLYTLIIRDADGGLTKYAPIGPIADWYGPARRAGAGHAWDI